MKDEHGWDGAAGTGGPDPAGPAGGTHGGRGPGSAREAPGDGRRSRTGTEGGADQESGGRTGGFADGIRQGLGVLSAFKEALEETIKEARERGDLSPERARTVVQDAVSRARDAAGEARERFDFAPQQEVDDLAARVEELERRVRVLERGSRAGADGGDPGP
jgi:polyhydroxyalkanoate synthesis regulator phasin